ncbi:Ras-related protein Rab [Acrasis kona]|uniref:Ras-related protein Rab n=1 Tax=Acrasis kona TaxID=1008807 RepID=A0AAW2Z6I7_9EUKA
MGNSCSNSQASLCDVVDDQIDINRTDAVESRSESIFEQSDEINLKFVLLGDSAVGKTSFLYRLTEDRFFESHVSSIGVDYKTLHFNVNEKKVHVQLWDTAGQDRYRSIAMSYIRGADAAILMYDITRASTFQELSQKWMVDLKNINDNTVIGILGNKTDLEATRMISTQNGKLLSDQEGAVKFTEISAKNSAKEDLLLIFQEIVEFVLKARH